MLILRFRPGAMQAADRRENAALPGSASVSAACAVLHGTFSTTLRTREVVLSRSPGTGEFMSPLPIGVGLDAFPDAPHLSGRPDTLAEKIEHVHREHAMVPVPAVLLDHPGCFLDRGVVR